MPENSPKISPKNPLLGDWPLLAGYSGTWGIGGIFKFKILKPMPRLDY